MFKDLAEGCRETLKKRVDARREANLKKMRARTASATAPSKVDVNVISHHMQRFAVWFGGSMLASHPEFYRVCKTKEQYDEEGPRIMRHNPVFNATM